LLLRLLKFLSLISLISSCHQVNGIGKAGVDRKSTESSSIQSGNIESSAIEKTEQALGGQEIENPEDYAVDIPQNIAGSYLHTQLSSDDRNYNVVAILKDPNTREALRLPDSERIEWQWDANIGTPQAQVVEKSTLVLKYTNPDNPTIESILNMKIRATWFSADGRSFAVETTVGKGQQSPQYSKQMLTIASTNTTMTINLGYSLTEGQYLVTRTTDQELPFYPTPGQNYLNAVGTLGILYVGTNPSIFADGFQNGTYHKIQVWHQSPGFGYQLLGNWKTYTGSMTNRDFSAYDFSGFSLNVAEFRSSRFFTVNFSNSDLTNSDFRRTLLDSVSFTGAILRNVDFTDATLGTVSFEGADLSGAVWIDGRVCKEGSIGLCL
jgi:hypothetical protein